MSLGGALECRGAGQSDHRVFGRDVCGDHWIADDAADARDVDDRAAVSHLGQRVLHPEEGAAGVHGHDAVEFGFVEVGHRCGPTGNAGGVHDGVYRAVCGCRGDVATDVG